jgi:ribosomal protein L37AE/L43A
MNTADFNHLFSNDDACRKYLFDLKWRDGFKCKKCGSLKGSVKANYIYKCNKCYYAESVTAHTLFKGVRFGLHKAFSIVNDTVEAKNLSNFDISSRYNISKVSAWRFLKKIPKYNLDMVLLDMSRKGK